MTRHPAAAYGRTLVAQALSGIIVHHYWPLALSQLSFPPLGTRALN